jgi:transcriptional regulator with XRE-family HTH domain
MFRSNTQLAGWLIQACEARNLSWAEASRRAGLSQGAISAIVRGTQPGLESCKALASFFGVPAEEVLRMAGHLAPVRGQAWPPELVALVEEVERLPPPLQRAAIRAWRAVLEGIASARDADS